MELNRQNYGEGVFNCWQEWQTVQGTLSQSPQGRNIQVEVDSRRRKLTHTPPLLARQSMGYDLKINPRKVKLA